MSHVYLQDIQVLSPAGLGFGPFDQALRAAQPLRQTYHWPHLRSTEARFAAIDAQSPSEPGRFPARLHKLFDTIQSDSWSPDTPWFVATSLGEMSALEARVVAGQSTEGLDYQSADKILRTYTQGTIRTINTACSSANHAFALARLHILQGRSDDAWVLAYDFISPFVYSGFSALGAMDPEDAKPFSASRAGLNLGEVAIAMRLSRRRGKSSVALIAYGNSNDAHHLTRPDLSGDGLARAISGALSDAQCSASDIAAICAHGTATLYNDQMEEAAFLTVFAKNGAALPALHASKRVFGHTLGAAAAVNALAAVAMLNSAIVYSSYAAHDTADDTFGVLHREQNLRGDKILSCSSGFGGSNAVVIWASAP